MCTALLAYGSSFAKAVRPLNRACVSGRCQIRPASSLNMTVSLREDRCIPETLRVGSYDICGVSVGAVETCVCIPSLSLAFDSGRCPPRAVSMRYMAITHGHIDHIHGLPLHLATRSLQKLPTPKYIMSPDIVDDVRNFVNAVEALERTTFDFDVHPMSPSTEPLAIKKGWFLKSFKTVHTVPSQGYILYKAKKRLKREYRGISGKELAQMRKSGVTLEETFEEPEIAFTGDTTLDAIASSEECQTAKILITEMTFIDNSCSPEDAKRFGHIHIEEVIRRKELFSGNEFIVFTHFSARYSKEEIQKALRRLPPEVRDKSVAFGAGSTGMKDG